MAPGAGELFDGAHALISLARGDAAGAALAAAAMILGAGIGATSATWTARYGDEAAAVAQGLERLADAGVVLRMVEASKPGFQRRPGETGLSVFDTRIIGAEELLPLFRPGSQVVERIIARIRARGMDVIS